MIDVTTEEMIPLRDVPGFLPKRNGKKLNLATIYRWTQNGLTGVYLEVAYHGGTQCTSAEALARFDAELTRIKCGPREPKQSTTKQAEKAHARALAKLSSART